MAGIDSFQVEPTIEWPPVTVLVLAHAQPENARGTARNSEAHSTDGRWLYVSPRPPPMSCQDGMMVGTAAHEI